MKFISFTWCLGLWLAATTCLAQSNPNPVPSVDQPLVPGAVAPGSPEFSLTIHGAGFVSGSTINWNGTPLTTTFESAAKLSAVVPAANVSTAGTVNVTVVSPSPGGGSSNPVPFTIIPPAFNPVFNAFPVAGTTTPISVVTADFNHDSIPDLAVIDQAPSSCNYQNHAAGSIAILLGNGDGTFTKHSTLCFVDVLGDAPQALAVTGDLNRDGNVDLVAVSHSQSSEDQLAIYYGNGDGTFTGPFTTPVQAAIVAMAAVAKASTSGYFQNIRGLALGDLYSNGQLNIAVSEINDYGNSEVYILPEGDPVNVGDPTNAAGPLSVGDFNGDGVLDVADAPGSYPGDTPLLKMFLNAGNGSFTQLPNVPFGDGAPIVSGDFNGDGILDIATANGNSVSVLLGDGDGTFTQKNGQPTSAQTNVGLITTDLNGDGILDLAIIDSTNLVSIWLGNGDGTFQAPVDTTGRGDGVVAADFNGDGRMDLAVTNSAEGTVTVLLQPQTPTVTFTGAPSSAVYGSEFTIIAKTNASTDAVITASGACTVSGVSSSGASIAATILMTSGTGTCNLAANWGADQTYTAASLSQSTLAAKAPQTISSGPIATQTEGTSLLLSATATSDLPVSFLSGSPSVCTVSSATATLIQPGTCSIEALQAGNANYLAATTVVVSFNISGFTITPIPSAETVRRGILAAFLLEIKAVNGLVGNVKLSCSGGPAGSVCGDLPKTVKLNQIALAISGILFPAKTTPGTYTITFTGASGPAVSTATATFTVQ